MEAPQKIKDKDGYHTIEYLDYLTFKARESLDNIKNKLGDNYYNFCVGILSEFGRKRNANKEMVKTYYDKYPKMLICYMRMNRGE